MKALHFGAGNIGRGFIGLILQQSGYEVTFADINENIIGALTERNEYTVEIADESHEKMNVTGVQGIHSQKDPSKLIKAVIEADLITTAVGPNVLKYLAPTLAEGLRQRVSQTEKPLHIIACENMVRGTSQFQEQIQDHLSIEEQASLQGKVAFLDAAVDRIVPLQANQDPLHVIVEPFYEWVIETKGLLLEQLPILQAHFVNDLQPYIERKLFTVNTGHAAAAYLGYQKGYRWIAEAIQDPDILTRTRSVLEETGYVLTNMYSLDHMEHQKYIEKILSRFLNPYLRDEVIRIARSPIRKLQPGDRLVAPARKLLELGKEPVHLSSVIAAALKYDYKEDPEAQKIQQYIAKHGLENAISHFTGATSDSKLFSSIQKNL
ncbi:mannitol-1-phosphate 5-dehydrogenase [Risungbinella massiliensis]|uniref:mannitol-1-phosphate 5-dehydrogenase n=1 Tax=Risungbinella massiliensis TaxID=1329796 RepID=UPI0005CC1A74|nr:mannitol-1-phosphate 5-dehydrogenase [Risungbinella massiliensis]